MTAASLTLSILPSRLVFKPSNRSAICTAFSAAPLRSWSPATNNDNVLPLGSLTSLADAPDQHFVLAAGVHRHGEVVALEVVDHFARPARPRG